MIFLLILILSYKPTAQTILNPNETYTKTFNLTPPQNVTLCNLDYSTGYCCYIYKCYAILPEGCNEPDCAVDKMCYQIDSLENQSITVVFTPQPLTRFGVMAFLVEICYSYDPGKLTWIQAGNPEIIEQQTDLVEVNIPPPPAPSPWDIWNIIIDFLHQIWCTILSIFGWGC